MEADQVSSAIACRAPILVERLALRLDAPYFTPTVGEEQASSFLSRTVATVPLILSARDSSYSDELLTSCPGCGPREEKYGGSTQSSVIEGKGRKETIIPTVVNTAAVLITVVIVIIAGTFVRANTHPCRLASKVGWM